METWQEYRVLHMKAYVHLWHHTEFFLEWEMFQTEFSKKVKNADYQFKDETQAALFKDPVRTAL